MSEKLRQQLAAGLAEPALQALSDLQLPQSRTEAWRYSPLRALERALAGSPSVLPAAPAIELGDEPGSAEWPNWRDQPAQLTPPGPADQALRWLAAASGAAEIVLAGEHTQPLRIDALAGLSATAPHRHRRVRVEAGAQLVVIEHWRDSGLPLANLLTEIEVGAGAQLTWLRLVEGSTALHGIARSEFRLAERAQLQHYTLELDAAWSRHDLRIELAGRDSRARSFGLLPVASRRHADTQLAIIHAVGHTQSESRWRAVAADRSRAVFNGRIQIDAGADDSDAALHIGSLLLSNRAEIDAKPELEIYADAVKASHGAAIGQLDPQALFYLRSRGLPQAQARQLLMNAWCREALEGLPPALLEAIEPRLAAALARLDDGDKA